MSSIDKMLVILASGNTENSIAEEFKPLIAIRQSVGIVRGVTKGLK